MQLLDSRPRPAQQRAGEDAPSAQWFRGLVAAPERPLYEGEAAPYSFAAACECPDDCLRDHDNE